MGKNTYEMEPVRVEAFHMTHERIKAFRASETDQSEWPVWVYDAVEKRPTQDGSITSFEEGRRMVPPEGGVKCSTADYRAGHGHWFEFGHRCQYSCSSHLYGNVLYCCFGPFRLVLVGNRPAWTLGGCAQHPV